jgi:hypothetical protein
MSGDIVLGGNSVTGAALTPTTASELTSKSYVDGILGSATAASASAAAAAISETNAAASYDSFDDRYLGAKSSAPTVDNDGDALLTGALYFNSTSDDLWVWDGAVWVQGAFSIDGLLTVSNNLSDLADTSAALVNLGITATASELNALDGITATVTELNYTDGVTSNIQTQIDAKVGTGKAIAMAIVFG